MNLAIGEIWMADMGYFAKVRPVVILSLPTGDSARDLIVVVPLTTAIRGGRGEVDIGQPRGINYRSVVNVNAIGSISPKALTRRLTKISDTLVDRIKDEIRVILNL